MNTPKDIILEIISYLDVRTIYKLLSTCTRLRLLDTDELARRILYKHLRIFTSDSSSLLDKEVSKYKSHKYTPYKFYLTRLFLNKLVRDKSLIYVIGNHAIKLCVKSKSFDIDRTCTFTTKRGFVIGEYTWAVRIHHTTNGNTMIGVSVCEDYNSGYCCERSIGYIYNTYGYCQGSGNLWNWEYSMDFRKKLTKTSLPYGRELVPYGRELVTGDTIIVHVSISTISTSVEYILDGKSLGIAFNIKTNGKRIYPTFTLGNTNDSITYIPL